MAIALDSLGIPAVSLNAFQVRMETTSVYGNARLKKIDKERILHELASRKIVIVTGFQGVNRYEDYATLGSGGSDPTAVAAASASWDSCRSIPMWTAFSLPIPVLFREPESSVRSLMMKCWILPPAGRGVLHNRSVEMAKKYGVPLVVRSSLNNSEGTIVKEVTSVERMLISGVALDENAARISVMGLKDEPGIAFKLFNLLAKNNVNVDIILQSIGREKTKDISFTVNEEDVENAIRIIEENKERLTFHEVTSNLDVAKVSIVGAGMTSNPGVAAKMFEALYNVGININMISTSEIRITVLVKKKDGEKAMNAIHEAFFGNVD